MSEEEPSKEGAFNFAIDTLKRIGDILREITKISMIQTGEAQHVKIQLVWQLLTQSCMLIVDKDKEAELIKKLDKINPIFKSKLDSAGREVNVFKVYDIALERQINLFVIEIENTLQEEGKYFMPDKMDIGLF